MGCFAASLDWPKSTRCVRRGWRAAGRRLRKAGCAGKVVGLLTSLAFAQDRNWEIIETTRSKIEQFKRTMPLISDLRNPALRER